MKATIESAFCGMKRILKFTFCPQTSVSFPPYSHPSSSFSSVFYTHLQALKNATEVGITTHDQPFSRKIFHSISP